MLEEAQEIFDYLPINKTNTAESEYISHLWSAIDALSNGQDLAQHFVLMPFHLLFMLSLQYKILRVAKEKNKNYLTAFTINVCRDVAKVANPESVFVLTNLKESSMIDLFKLIHLDSQSISEIKSLVRYRNDKLAHANGGIAVDSEDRINQYLDVLKKVQMKFVQLNDDLADRWRTDMLPDDDKGEFVDIRLAEEYLCPADFMSGKLSETFPFMSDLND